MSSESVAAPHRGHDPAVESARRAALRLAFGTTACFALVEAFDLDATFLAPLLAANMLVKLQRPPSLRQGLIFILIFVLSTAGVLALTATLIGKPTVLILALALVMYLTFYAHRRGAPDLVTFLPQVSAVAIPVIAVVSPDGAGTFAGMMVMSGVVALVTLWGAHAAFPAPAAALADGTPPAIATGPAEPTIAARHAILDTLVLLPVLTWYILDATQVAVVMLIMIVTLLRQHSPEQGQRAALGLVLGNLIGGIAASIVYNLLLVSHTLLFFVTACLATSLIFAGRIVTAPDRAPIYAIAFATFLLLLGLGISPLPGGSGEAFASRLFYVVLASVYTIGALSIVAPWRNVKPR